MYLFVKNILRSAAILSTLLLIACTAPQTSVKLQPQISIKPSTKLTDNETHWNVRSQDRRIAHYLIEISEGDGVAKLINESTSSRSLIENMLQKEWQQQGMKVDPDSDNIITVQLLKLLAKVKQKQLSFDNKADIAIRIELKTANDTFTKTYKSRFTQEGVFNADSDKISHQLSTQLSQLLNEIIQDPELNSQLIKQ